MKLQTLTLGIFRHEFRTLFVRAIAGAVIAAALPCAVRAQQAAAPPSAPTQPGPEQVSATAPEATTPPAVGQEPTDLFAPNPAALPADAPVVPDATQTYTLDQCTQMALDNPRVSLRWSVTQDGADRSVDLAEANLNPTLGSALTASDSSSNTFSATNAYVVPGERLGAGVTASVPIYNSGALADEVQLARKSADATTDSIVEDQYSVLSQVASTYFDVLSGQRDVADGLLSLQIAQEQLDAANSQLAVGTATKEDVLAAQSALATAESTQSGLDYALSAARISLASICNMPEGELPGAVAPEAAAELSQPSDKLVALALQNSPEYNRLVTETRIARLQLGLIKARNSPAVTLIGSTGVALVDDASGSTGLSTTPYGLVSLDLKAPIFSRPVTRAEEEGQKDQIVLSDLAVKDFERQLDEQVNVNVLGLQSKSVQYAAAQAALADAEAAATLTEERYRVGKATETEVFSSISRLSSARTACTTASDSEDVAVQELRWAVGLDKPNAPVKKVTDFAAIAP